MLMEMLCYYSLKVISALVVFIILITTSCLVVAIYILIIVARQSVFLPQTCEQFKSEHAKRSHVNPALSFSMSLSALVVMILVRLVERAPLNSYI